MAQQKDITMLYKCFKWSTSLGAHLAKEKKERKRRAVGGAHNELVSLSLLVRRL